MKLLLKTAIIALITSTLAACASSPAPIASSRNAYLEQRAEMPSEQPVTCGQKSGRCTALFHETPTQRPATSVESTLYPLELPKPEHLSALDE
jgi:starvation-inducible outer membrane lipoprotein